MSTYSSLSDNEWLDHLVNPRNGVPQLPPKDMQERFCGRSGMLAMQQALEFYKVIRESTEKVGMPLKNVKAVLDFGCGWGRISRCFLRDLPSGTLYGTDCIPEMVQYCKDILPGYHFTQNNPMPPTWYPPGMFDIVYAYSVFSHLSEAAHKAWLEEFYRVMKPGGILVLTTRPRAFVSYWPNLPYLRPIDVNQCLGDYDAGKLVHIPSGGGDNLSESFYGETAIPEAYMFREWSKWFTIQQFNDAVPQVDQKVIVARRK